MSNINEEIITHNQHTCNVYIERVWCVNNFGIFPILETLSDDLLHIA